MKLWDKLINLSCEGIFRLTVPYNGISPEGIKGIHILIHDTLKGLGVGQDGRSGDVSCACFGCASSLMGEGVDDVW